MAIIRTRGGIDGIQRYLVEGKKLGRSFTRNELDERIIFGNLDLTNKIIQSIDSRRERYIHTTISFKEDALRLETFRDIVEDFKVFAFAAYNCDEYNYYAEAHLPRIKSYIDADGMMIVRLPHIHFIVPRLNLLSSKDLNPFGLYMNNIPFIDAFQEHINNKYGSVSPANSRRAGLAMESTMLSRSIGDVFEGENSEFKASLVAEIIKKKVTDYEEFRKLLAEKGETKSRNIGKVHEHEAVKPSGKKMYINLRHFVFSREFIELSTEQKIERLRADAKVEYCSQTEPKSTPRNVEAVLNDWRIRRSKEIKYLNSGNAKQYNRYKEATVGEKCKILDNYQMEFYKKYRDSNERDFSADPVLTNQVGIEIPKSRATRPLNGRCFLETGREIDTSVAQLLRHKQELSHAQKAINDPIIRDINRHLNVGELLKRLTHSHGVILGKYEIEQYEFFRIEKDGSGRIRCGNRNYNVSDFLTKELHIPWAQASIILRDAYAVQMECGERVFENVKPNAVIWKIFQLALRENISTEKNQRKEVWKVQRESELVRAAKIREYFNIEKLKIRTNKKLSNADRRSSLSLCVMNRVSSETALREKKKGERAELRIQNDISQMEMYRRFLQLRARGDEAALAELRRHRVSESRRFVTLAAFDAPDGEGEQEFQLTPIDLLGLTYEIDIAGNVTYSNADRQILRDEGGSLAVLDANDDAVVELALRCAYAKFGNKMKITGKTEFREKVARIIVQGNLYIEFDDQFTNNFIEELRTARFITDKTHHDANYPTSKIR